MCAARALSIMAGIIRGRGYYKKYEKMYNRNLKKIPSFKLILKLSRGRVLDVGCGIGYLSRLFQDYVGVDVNKEAINIAKRNTRREYIIGDAYHLPFRAKMFDTCISYDFIEHIRNVESVLSEMKRISRSKVIMSCVDFRSYYKMVAYDKTHVGSPTADNLSNLLSKYFEKIRVFQTSGIFSAPQAVNIFLSKYFPNQIVLEASI